MLKGVKAEYAIEVAWEGGRRYRGGPPGVPGALLDGDRKTAPSPVDSILVALATCSAIDVVDILEKRRTPVSSISARVEFSRAPTPPRRLTQVHSHFTVATDSDPSHVERALELSFEKYCSVANSLAPDTELTWAVEVIPPAAAEVGT